MSVDVVHVRHYLDGFPLCWGIEQTGTFVASDRQTDVTCPACLAAQLEDDDEDPGCSCTRDPDTGELHDSDGFPCSHG